MGQDMFSGSNTDGSVDQYFYRKEIFGSTIPDGAGGMGFWETVSEIAAGMFWPVATDNSVYTMGVTTNLKASADLKVDFGGDINWNMMGFTFHNQFGLEFRANFKEDEWATWAWDSIGARLSAKLLSAEARAAKLDQNLFKIDSQTTGLKMGVTETDLTAAKVVQRVKHTI